MSKAPPKKLRSPLKWHGGKSYLARRIISLFPPHRLYLEPYIGGGSVLLNKPRSDREIVGDLNAELIKFWSDLRMRKDDPEHYPWTGDGWEFLPDMINRMGYCEGVFLSAKEGRYAEARPCFGPSLDFLILNRFSRGGLGKDFAWSERLRGGQPGDLNAWETFKEELPSIIGRIRDVDFRHGEALELIRLNDTPAALIYCDPPYLHETRTHRKAYACEMTADQHGTLLETLLACRGKVFLSGYRSSLYDSALAGWTRHEWELPNHSGQGSTKQRRVECLWENRK